MLHSQNSKLVTWLSYTPTTRAYLLLNSMSLSHHGIEVVTFGNAVEHELLDPHLQVCVGALQ